MTLGVLSDRVSALVAAESLASSCSASTSCCRFSASSFLRTSTRALGLVDLGLLFRELLGIDLLVQPPKIDPPLQILGLPALGRIDLDFGRRGPGLFESPIACLRALIWAACFSEPPLSLAIASIRCLISSTALSSDSALTLSTSPSVAMTTSTWDF